VIDYYYDDGFPSGVGWHARVVDSTQTWSVVQPSAYQFLGHGTVSQTFEVDCNASTDVVLFYRQLDFLYGQASACKKSSGAFRSVHIAFDNEMLWYTGTGDPSEDYVVLDHIATHELGHATGMPGHFQSQNDCDQIEPPTFNQWQTMCNAVDELLFGTAYSEMGRVFRRTLDSHDIHTFQAAY
jgi:hypothetical protein